MAKAIHITKFEKSIPYREMLANLSQEGIVHKVTKRKKYNKGSKIYQVFQNLCLLHFPPFNKIVIIIRGTITFQPTKFQQER